ncbi:hypothetical protein GJ688_06925 [Heliobacillus mobilis]|uniref:O-methyltransferase domain-containing protein n=1 Tax=Heliobacterium mobile TaxID=28064 RepID=A0A6I3SIJ8_HELMO|nr:hypothetical protein [Heliobacterium mobile]MTV48711.1 hypothetical protein [Heliobacterium mobile]
MTVQDVPDVCRVVETTIHPVHQSLMPGGRIAILDFVRGMSPIAELFGVNMLVNTKNGSTWTLEQYTEWLEEAGFGAVRVRGNENRQVILAEKR